MKRYRVLPYRQGSKSAKALADALGGKVLKLVGSKFKPKPDDVIINWGNTGNWPHFGFHALNGDTGRLKGASNKLLFFSNMQANAPDIIPRFWTTKEDIPHEAFPIVCRTTLAGHSGDGIVIADNADALVEAPLYVEYKKKKEEYRVHVGKTTDSGNPVFRTIAIQRKARRLATPDNEVNWKVRNLKGGFVFVRNEVTPPSDSIVGSATAALEASGLDFGAVDVIWNAQEGKAYVLEINTAPGLEGQTITDYANFFKSVPT